MKEQSVHTRIYKSCLAILLLLALTIAPMAGSLAGDYTKIINPYNSSRVNLRSAPGYDSDVLACYPVGTAVEILQHGTWMYVNIKGCKGYIHADFVNVKGIGTPVPTSAPTATSAPCPTSTPAAPSIPAAKDEYRYVSTSNGGNLNLRVKPSFDADVIGSYAPGTRVKVLLKGETWYKVEVNGKIGYMNTKFLSKNKPAEKPSTNEILTSGTVRVAAGQTVNLRETASLKAKVLGQYKNGTKLYVFSKSGDWYKVCIGNTTGYMMSQFVNVGGHAGNTKTVINNNGGSYANLRSFAGMHYKVLQRVNVGTKVEVIEKGEFWTQVRVNGTTGYMNNYFLK